MSRRFPRLGASADVIMPTDATHERDAFAGFERDAR
jgi:hypothetical protein